MNLSRHTRSKLAFSLCLTALTAAQIHHQFRLTQLASAITEAPAGILLPRLEDVERRMAEFESLHPISGEAFEKSQQEASTRIDAIQTRLQLAEKDVEDLSQKTSFAEDSLALKVSVELMGMRLDKIEHAQVKPYPPQLSAHRASPARRANSTPPPFTAIGIEHRGGQQFLSVAPIGSTALHQIHLIRIGDTVPGTAWILRSVDADAAKFDVAGASRTLPITS